MGLFDKYMYAFITHSHSVIRDADKEYNISVVGYSEYSSEQVVKWFRMANGVPYKAEMFQFPQRVVRSPDAGPSCPAMPQTFRWE